MFAKLRRKPIIIGILALTIVALVAVFAIPAIAAGAPPWAARPAINNNVTVVQGTVASIDTAPSTGTTSIVINKAVGSPPQVTLVLDKNTNFNIHGIDWLTSGGLVGKSVTAVYKNNVTPLVASQVTINMPAPPPVTGNTTIKNYFGRVQGTLTVSGETITVTPTTGAGGAVGPLTLDKNTNVGMRGATLALANGSLAATVTSGGTASVFYNSQTKVASQIMINMPAPAAQPSPGAVKPPAINTFARVQGVLTVNTDGTIVVTPTGKTGIKLSLDANSNVDLHGATLLAPSGLTATIPVTVPVSVSVAYNSQTNIVNQMMIGAPAIAPAMGIRPGNPGPNFGGPNGPIPPPNLPVRPNIVPGQPNKSAPGPNRGVPGPNRFGGA
jgi:hypothetical protein